MKDGTYYVVQSWMPQKLNLKGNALAAFAIIYGFSQDGESNFTGSINYLCGWLGCSRPTVSKALDELVRNNYILKTSEIKNGVLFNTYKANIDLISSILEGSKESLQGTKKIDTGSKESLQGHKETLQGGSKESLHNNYSSNNSSNIDRDNTRKKKNALVKDFVFEDYAKENSELLDAFIGFEEMRNSIKCPMTERAKKVLITNLEALSKNPDEQIAILNQSIMNNWKSVYALKSGNVKSNQQQKKQLVPTNLI